MSARRVAGVWLAALLAACGARAPQESEPASSEPSSAPAALVRAEAARGRSWLDAPATVLAAPEASAAVSAPMALRVVRVRVRRGEQVAADQPVLDVVMPDLMRAAGVLSAATIRLEAHERRRATVARLLEQGLARASELAELDAQIALARADREGARATLRTAGVSDASAAGLLAGSGALSLRAPIAGMVLSLSTQLGEVREPGSGPLLELAGSAAVQVEARFAHRPPADARFVWLGPSGECPLELETVSPRVSERDGSWLAWLHPAAEGPPPAPGQAGVARLVPPDDAVVLPLAALREEGGKTFVEASGEHAARVPVEVVLRGSGEAVVRGVAAGTSLLVARSAP